jgi:hypothetical protein
MKKKAQPRDKVSVERDPVSHKTTVVVRLTPREANVLRGVTYHIGGIGRARDTMTTIGQELSLALRSSGLESPCTTNVPPKKYAFLGGQYGSLHIYDLEPDVNETSTDPRPPAELDVKSRAIMLD